jgi:hypothetical protein
VVREYLNAGKGQSRTVGIPLETGIERLLHAPKAWIIDQLVRYLSEPVTHAG